MMFREIFYSTHIDINADADDVFAVIADFDGYNRWNPWLIQAQGQCREGEIADVTVRLGAKTMKVKHKVLEVVPGKRLRWCDMGWFTLFAYGERSRSIEALPGGGVRYRNELPITGPLRALADMFTGKAVREGMAAENLALKQFVEAAA